MTVRLLFYISFFLSSFVLLAQEDNLRTNTFNDKLCELVSVYAPDSIIAEQQLDKNSGSIKLNIPSDSLEQEGISLSGESFFSLLGQKVNYPKEVYNFYQQRLCESTWFSEKQKLANADTLIQVLNEIEAHGLQNKNYHVDTLSAIYNEMVMRLALKKPIDTTKLLDFEILMTDAAISFAHDLRIGRINPSDVLLEYNIAQDTAFVANDLVSAINAQELNSYYMGIAPHFEQYDKLKTVLDDYIQKAQNYEWDSIATGETIKIGMTDARLPQIRQRLQLLDSGDDSGNAFALDTSAIAMQYDSLFLVKVKDFQLRHGLNPDGEIGTGTLEQLNLSLQDRIAALSINLERWRWMPRNIGERYLVVNIAGYFLQVYDADTLSFTKKVVVGKTYTKTPVFSEIIQYIEFNPTWTVPYSIRSREMLPKLKSNPGYLANNDMVLLSGGRKIDPYSVDWQSITSSNFPYAVRQEPGSQNALGTMKFIFPNKYNVYLHDTPSKSKFNEYQRAFSHGCVRLHEPKQLADYLLAEDYSPEKIDRILNRKKTKKVYLKTPVPIYIMYWSVWVDEQGNPYFMKDIYKRDKAVKDAYFSSQE